MSNRTEKEAEVCKGALRDSDIRVLEASWIDVDLAVEAGIERVDSCEGARLIGREKEGFTNKYAGLWFPNISPSIGECGGRLRRDSPEIEFTGDGKRKEKAKYLTAPGEKARLYFGPEQSLDALKDASIPIVITEGEKKTLALYRLARYQSENRIRFIAIGIPGVWNWRGKIGMTVGPKGESLDVKGVISDFDLIEWDGRDVYICFDSDWQSNPAVRSARKQLTEELRRRKARVHYFDVPSESGFKGVDDWVGGKGPDEVIAAFETIAETPVSLPGTFQREGKSLIHVNEDGETRRICTYVEVLYRTSSPDSDSWGKLLRWDDDDGKEHKWIMPSELLASAENIEIRRYLLNRGVNIEGERQAHRLLHFYLSAPVNDARRMLTSTRLGWNEQQTHYLLPDETIGSGQIRIIFQDNWGSDNEHPYRVRGTLEEWQDNISRNCSGNSRLAFAVSAAFAGPLLRLLNTESGGVHLYGKSSKGKSTALRVAKSVWGTGNSSWNATRNGLESQAERFNDSLLVLDEIGEADAKDAAESVYMLANGTGRARMTQSIEARRTLRWRLVFLSSGEITLSDHVKTSGKQVKAGSEVRLLNIPAEAHQEYGLFEDVGEHTPAEFAKLLNENAQNYYGSASRAFLRWLVMNREHAVLRAREIQCQFVEAKVTKSHCSEVRRAADRFAMFSAAGTLATEAGVTGWTKNDAVNSAGKCFEAWLVARGTIGSSDDDRAIRQVRQFLELHGSSRFENNSGDSSTRIPNRAGVREVNGSVFYISSEVFKSEVCSGFDHVQVARLLKERGHLEVDSGDRLTKKPRLKIKSLSGSRFYTVNFSIFDGYTVGEEEDAA